VFEILTTLEELFSNAILSWVMVDLIDSFDFVRFFIKGEGMLGKGLSVSTLVTV
jgi:hypothetical protein